MNIKRFDTTIMTTKLKESKEFYMQYFNLKLVYESDWYLELVMRDYSAGISFTLSQRDVGEFFNGRGLLLSFEVEDVDKEYQRLVEAGVQIFQGLQDKPWGERSFVIDDPNGVHLYIYKSIPSTPEYQEIYDKYK